MNDITLEAVSDEFRGLLPARRIGKVFPLSRRSFAIDLRLSESRYLLVAAEPSDPRTHLIRRRLKDLEKAEEHPQPFHLLLKKHLSGTTVTSIEKAAGERVIAIRTLGTSETGEQVAPTLLLQLTGKSSNVFLLDDRNHILGSLIGKDVDGQRIGERYDPPAKPRPGPGTHQERIEVAPHEGSISEALDIFHQKREADRRFDSLAQNARRELQRELRKRSDLVKKLQSDLQSHGDAEKWKRYGDLILANLSTAKRNGNKVAVTDFFQNDTPEVEIEVDENISLTNAAQEYFKRYSKAQKAATEIARRSKAVEAELLSLKQRQAELEQAIAERDDSYFTVTVKQPTKPKKEKARYPGARQFTSSDGFEILVGKRAIDNDHLTFRIAGPLDVWLHAADYAGSHVVVRNPNRKEVPQKTLLEAARLAAFYSSGKSQPKAAVHYTQKKFVNKPKGAAAGLVRLASFKTILVEPSIPEALDQKTIP